MSNQNHEVAILVNGKQVMVMGPRTTGLQIKQAAIAQGVSIKVDFVLSEELEHHKSRIVGDNEEITINKNSRFIAVAPDDNSMDSLTLKSAVGEALDQLKAEFSSNEFVITEDGSGGAAVLIEKVPLGPPYAQEDSWFGFRIAFQYPFADTYPHFVRGDLSRVDGKPLGDGMSAGQKFMDRAAVQISRRSNHLNPATDTALLKLLKVIHWLRRK